ncbi:hypothetical protein ABPG75_004671 [Micractinium tetrahymenae]
MTSCVPCPGGTVPTHTAPTDKCLACPNGQYRDAYTVSATCTDCGPGNEVGPSSKMACTQCRPGTYMTAVRAAGSGTSANTCDMCPQHTYRPTYGATSCLPCPCGTNTANTGNTECTACPIGYYNNAANDNCNPCPPGKYANTLGSKECKATSCLDCKPGYSAPAGAAACSPCRPGTYAPDAKSATCKLRPKGFHCPTNAMSKQGPCPRGTFSNKEGLKLCAPCPANTYSLDGGTAASTTAVMACVKCAPGTNTRGLVGPSKCQVIRPQVKRLLL